MLFDFEAFDEPQYLYIPIPPVPASRPKVAKFGVYYGKRHKEYMKSFAAFLKVMPPQWTYLPEDKRLFIIIEFACKRLKCPSKVLPRYDIDNLMKLPLDCMTSSDMFWKDDCQIEALVARKRYAEPNEEPHTKVQVMSL
jgi:Holliday junction resolvase RusA-like endonuclease|tara:strand:+ start:1777 stop:2193 length:417 start_codon:yes stop_codon:yes gene_type:complete